MRHEDFSMKRHGFAGHLAEPDFSSDRAVIVIMGGEKSLLPGIKIAERFADYGITGLAVSLFGAPGLPKSPDRIPLDMFVPAVNYLRDRKHIEHISIYGQSMGTIFAVLAAEYIGGIENLILVSPAHVPFEGTKKNRKKMSGHSIVTYHGGELPFVKTDFGNYDTAKYYKHDVAECRVTGMWIAFHDAYADKEQEKKAELHIEKTGTRILMIAGHEDEMWPAEYSVRMMTARLRTCGYEKETKTVIYPHGSHLSGMMPDPHREKLLYRMIPMIGRIYKTFGKYRKINLMYLEQSEKEIISWINAV